jgi:hypothetical protein
MSVPQDHIDDLEKVRLELTGDGYQYDIYPLRGIDESQRKDAVSIAPPGRAPAENILLGIKGMEGSLTVNFALHNDGTDKANGTAPTGDFANDTVVTVAEQREWLLDYIHDPGFSASWTLTHLTGDILDGIEVFVENPDISYLQQDSPKWTDASIRLRRGSSL